MIVDDPDFKKYFEDTNAGLPGVNLRALMGRSENWMASADEDEFLACWPKIAGLVYRVSEARDQRAGSRRVACAMLDRYSSQQPPRGLNGEAAAFVCDLAEQVSKHKRRNVFRHWVKSRCGELRSEELKSFLSSCPRTVSFDPNWEWELFDLMLEYGLNPLECDAIPHVSRLKNASRQHREQVWNLLLAAQRYDTLLTYTAAFALEQRQMAALRLHVVALGRLARFAEIRQLLTNQNQPFNPQEIRSLSKQVIDDYESNRKLDINVLADALVLLEVEGCDPFLVIKAVKLKVKSAIRDGDQANAASLILQLPPEVSQDPNWATFLTSTKRLYRRHFDLTKVTQELAELLPELYRSELISEEQLSRACRQLIAQGSHQHLLRLLNRMNADREPVVLSLRYQSESALGRTEDAIDTLIELLSTNWLNDGPRYPLYASLLTLLIAFERQSDPAKEVDDEDPNTSVARLLAEYSKRSDISRVVIGVAEFMWLLQSGETTCHEVDLRQLFSQFQGECADLLALLTFLRQHAAPAIITSEYGELPYQSMTTECRLEWAKFLTDYGLLDAALVVAETAMLHESLQWDAKLLTARIAVVQNESRTAQSLCEEVERAGPKDEATWRKLLRVYRLNRASDESLRNKIISWCELIEEPNQRTREKIALLLIAGQSGVALLEAWKFYQANEQVMEASLALGECLYQLGEMGCAEYFLEASMALGDADIETNSRLEQISAIRSLLQQPAVEASTAIEVCAQIVEHIEAQGRLPDACDEDVARQRVRCPEVLIDLAMRIAPEADDAVGPICLATATLGPGGAERQVAYTAKGLAGRAQDPSEVVVLCLSQSGLRDRFFHDSIEESGVRVVLASPTRRRRLGPSPVNNRAADFERIDELLNLWPVHLGQWQLRRYYDSIREIRPAVLHTWQDRTNVLAGLAGILAGVSRIVLSGRSLRPRKLASSFGGDRYAYRRLVAQPRVTLTNNSVAGATDYADWLGLSPDEVRVISNGYDFEEMDSRVAKSTQDAVRDSLGMPEDGLLVGAVLRMSDVKRPQLALDSLARVVHSHENCWGVLIGGGPLFQQIEEAAKQYDRAERIHILSTVSPIEPWMAAMDVLILTSKVEGLPNVLIEAQALGTPVVCTDAGGASETLHQDARDILIDSSDPDDIAAAVLTLLNDPSRRSKLSESSQANVRERFSLEQMIQTTLEVYRLTR